MIKLRAASGLRDTKWSLRTAAGLRNISSISLRTPPGLRTVYSSSGGSGTDALTPDEVDGFGYSKVPIAVTTDQATVDAPSGATIVWHFSSTGWTATNPTSATSAFRKTVAQGEESSTSVTATVTSGGVSTTSNAITATVTNNYGT